MKKLLTLMTGLVFAAALGAQPAPKAPQASATIAGKWDVVNPNRPAIKSLDLTVEGKTVRGTWGGEAVRGEIAGTNLTFAVPDTWLEWTNDSLGSEEMKSSAARRQPWTTPV